MERKRKRNPPTRSRKGRAHGAEGIAGLIYRPPAPSRTPRRYKPLPGQMSFLDAPGNDARQEPASEPG